MPRRFMRKAENLARNLLDIYGLDVISGRDYDAIVGYQTPWLLVVKPKQWAKWTTGHGAVYGCASWEEMLFGNGKRQRSLNEFLKNPPSYFCMRADYIDEELRKSMRSSIIEFDSLDELDVKLTLMGRRTDFSMKRA